MEVKIDWSGLQVPSLNCTAGRRFIIFLTSNKISLSTPSGTKTVQVLSLSTLMAMNTELTVNPISGVCVQICTPLPRCD